MTPVVSGHPVEFCLIQVAADHTPPIPDGFMQHRQVSTFEPNPKLNSYTRLRRNAEIESSGREQKKVPMSGNYALRPRQVAVIADSEGLSYGGIDQARVLLVVEVLDWLEPANSRK